MFLHLQEVPIRRLRWIRQDVLFLPLKSRRPPPYAALCASITVDAQKCNLTCHGKDFCVWWYFAIVSACKGTTSVSSCASAPWSFSATGGTCGRRSSRWSGAWSPSSRGRRATSGNASPAARPGVHAASTRRPRGRRPRGRGCDHEEMTW